MSAKDVFSEEVPHGEELFVFFFIFQLFVKESLLANVLCMSVFLFLFVF